jgi:hypothetical protein
VRQVLKEQLDRKVTLVQLALRDQKVIEVQRVRQVLKDHKDHRDHEEK